MGSPPSANLKKRIVIWASVFTVLIAVFFSLARLGSYFSSEILFQLVKRETKGYYELSFEKIDIDLWKRTIKLKTVLLKPDPDKDFQEKGLNNLYELEMAGLNIDLKSIISIYTIRQLHIKNIRIIDPQIHIMRKKDTPDESFSIQTGNLYKEISDYLRVLQIDVFTIDNASVKHFPSELGLNNIDFLISNLLINSDSRPDKEFYSENIELEIHDQSFKLKDSIHQISFDHFLLSTADSVLTFQNLILRPLSNTPGAYDTFADKTLYHISIPTLRLKGVDYFSAYRYNHLEMEELSLTDSYIFLDEQSKMISDKSGKQGNSIFEQLIEVFDEVRIGKMRFINANLDLKTNDDYNHNYQHVQSQRADIVLYDFILDSSNYQFDFDKKYFDNLDINIKDYRSYLPDSIHTLQFDLLKLSSIDSSLSFKNFNISNNGKGTSDLFLSIDVPQARLTGLNFSDVLLRKQLHIRDMFIHKPNIIFEHGKRPANQFDFTPDSLYKLIMEHFNVVGIRNLNISQGVFSINNLLRSEQTELSISDFNIPSESNTWYDVIGNIKLEMQAVVLDDEAIKLSANHLVLDPLSKSLILDELNLGYRDKQVVVSGDLSKLMISGIDLDHISTGNYHAFDSVSILNPRLNVEVLQPGNKQFGGDLLSDVFVEVIDGELNIKTYDSIIISLDNIFTDFTLGTINHIQSGVAENFSITLSNTSNKLNINQINLDKAHNLFLKSISLQPIKSINTQKVNLSGRIPELNMFGLDQNLFWEKGILAGDSLIVLSPDIAVNLKKVSKALSPVDSIEVQFEKIVLQKARLQYSDENQAKLKMLRIPQFSGTIEGFHYPEKNFLSPDHLFYSDNVTLHLTGIHPDLTSGNVLTIQELDFSKNNRRIGIKSLNYEEASGSFSARLPEIEMRGFDLDIYLNKQRLELLGLKLISPRILFDQSLKDNDINQDDSMPKSLDIGSFSSISTEIEIKDQKTTSYFIHDGNLVIEKFFAEGDLKWDRFFDYSRMASISGQNFVKPLGDGYEISIGKYVLQYPENTLKLEDISLTNQFSPAEYTQQLTFQKDWFDVNADGVTFSGVDFKRAFSKQEYKAGKVLVEGLDALIYRDKSVPLNASAVKELPQEMLQNIKHWIYIDTLQVKGDITHQINPVNTEEIAKLDFNALDASLYDITSVPGLSDKSMRLVSSGKLAGIANFKAQAEFRAKDPGNQFTFSGQIDEMPLSALNQLLRPLANINIKDGHAEEIRFNMNGNNEIATGEMDFRYNDLKIQILNPETNDMQGLNQEIKTFFANTFVIRQNNPTFIVLKSGTIFQRRDPSRVIFHYWGEALLSGAVSSIGINRSKKDERRYDKELEEQKR